MRGTFLTDLYGKDIMRLNYLCGEDVDPRFCPADERILFASTRGGRPGLWSMNRAGRQAARICDGDQGDWFPDGQRIALCRGGQIIERAIESGQETVRSPAGWNACRWPACSPDGRKVLFVASDGGKDWLMLATPGQTAPQRLAAGELPSARRRAPGGDRIVYQDGGHLWMIDADGQKRRQLTTAGGIQRRPVWSPDQKAVAYCQGPGPKGPWQMAVISSDGTKSFSIPPRGALSVLCADWGVKRPGRRPEATGAVAGPTPRIRLWALGPPASTEPIDWAAFCRERKGWRAVAAGNDLSQGLRGGCAVENAAAVLLLLAGKPGAVLLPKAAIASPVRLTLLDSRGGGAGPVEAIRVRSLGPDEAVLESSSR